MGLRGRRTTARALSLMVPEKRLPILVAFLVESLEDITDDAIEMFDRNLAGIHSKAKRDLVNFRISTAKSMDENLRVLARVGRLVLNPGVADVALRHTIFNHIDKKKLQAAVIDCDNLSRPRDNSVWDLFAKRYSLVRQFAPKFLDVFRFQVAKRLEGLLLALHNIRMVNAGHWPEIPTNSPVDFIQKTWEAFVFEDGKIQRRFYELCALWELRLGLRSGEVWSSHSKRHSNPDEWLISKATWPTVRSEYLAMVGLPGTWEEKRETCKKEYLAAIPSIRREVKKGTEIRIEKEKIVVSPIEGGKEPDTAKRLQDEITSRLPQVELTDILIEVDSWIKYSESFSHAGGEEVRLNDFQKRVYVALFAGACNLEHNRLAAQTDLTADQLKWFITWYIREETLQSATNRAVDYQFGNPFSKHFGTGMMSSSDGQRFPVPVKTRNACALPRYFGYGRGLTYYSWTSDLFAQFGVKVIPSTVRDATYIFDAICGNETDLPIAEHTTDTSGHTALVFAISDLLGIEFCPRIRDIADQRLLRLDGITTRDLGCVHILLKRSARLRDKLVAQHWDEMLRIGASVKMGYVTASLLISRLQAFPRKSALIQALIEYGRLRKTIFILRYLGSQTYRRRIGKQLNKGEEVHALKSFIAFGREGQIRKAQLETQTHQAGSLTLAANLVILWNTRYIEVVVKTLRAEGWAISDEDLSHISPCRFEHINRYGRFSFDFENTPQNGELRPLRLPENIS